MMYKIEVKVASNNEDVEEKPTFGNEDKRTIVLVWHRATIAKAKEWALLLFMRTESDKDGVPHLYIVTIPKTKTKLFRLAICYVLCDTSFLMAANIINYTYKVLSNPFLRFCTHYHVSNFVRVVCAINLQHIFDILWCLWAFSLAFDFLTHQNTSYLDWHICVYMEKHHTITNLHGCASNVPMTYGWSHVQNGL